MRRIKAGAAAIIFFGLAFGACSQGSAVTPTPSWSLGDLPACEEAVDAATARASRIYNSPAFDAREVDGRTRLRALLVTLASDLEDKEHEFPQYFDPGWNGFIDRLHVWSKTLSQPMVATDYETLSDEIGPAIGWLSTPPTLDVSPLGQPCYSIKSWIDANVPQ